MSAGPLVLASASPRRRELLELLGVDFEVLPTDVDELTIGPPDAVVSENARRKARAAAGLVSRDRLILAADTDVALDGRLLGKACGEEGARDRLTALSGRAHEVLGGVALVCGGEEWTELVRTRVTFRRLSSAEIDAYIASEEWRDRAGAYAVQGLGASLIEGVDGDLSNVIGLPIPALCRVIENLQNRKV